VGLNPVAGGSSQAGDTRTLASFLCVRQVHGHRRRGSAVELSRSAPPVWRPPFSINRKRSARPSRTGIASHHPISFNWRGGRHDLGKTENSQYGWSQQLPRPASCKVHAALEADPVCAHSLLRSHRCAACACGALRFQTARHASVLAPAGLRACCSCPAPTTDRACLCAQEDTGSFS
jgi:hypothetical protein